MYIWKKLLNFTMFHIAPGNNITLMITQIDFTHLSLHLLYVFLVLILNRTIFCLIKITIQSWIDKKKLRWLFFFLFCTKSAAGFSFSGLSLWRLQGLRAHYDLLTLPSLQSECSNSEGGISNPLIFPVVSCLHVHASQNRRKNFKKKKKEKVRRSFLKPYYWCIQHDFVGK